MPNRDIGIDVKAPAREPAPGDRLNPFNGSLPIRGSVIVGTVVSAKMQGTAIVEKQHQRLVEKFERYEKRTRRYAAHVPSNIDVHEGDEVSIAECRPISKTVTFVVVENRGNPAAVRAVPARNVPAKPEPKAKPIPASAEKPAAGKAAAPAAKPAKAPKKEA
ncbi:MAG: 30S ribosomal protein S17 [bacterium]